MANRKNTKEKDEKGFGKRKDDEMKGERARKIESIKKLGSV